MSDDVLSADHLRTAMETLRDAKPRPPMYLGPQWAKDHLAEHEGGQPGCDRCWKAWAVMVTL